MSLDFVHRHYRGLEPRITIWDPAILKQIQIKQFWSFPDRQVITAHGLGLCSEH